ncbi:MAG: hypothetical protein WAO98_04350 [Alphaproteobacteria bacterium]
MAELNKANEDQILREMQAALDELVLPLRAAGIVDENRNRAHNALSLAKINLFDLFDTPIGTSPVALETNAFYEETKARIYEAFREARPHTTSRETQWALSSEKAMTIEAYAGMLRLQINAMRKSTVPKFRAA